MPAAFEVTGGPFAKSPDVSAEIERVVEMSLYDLAVDTFSEYNLWQGSVDITSDEELTLDPKYQQEIDMWERTLERDRDHSDADWQAIVNERYEQDLARYRERMAEPDPDVPTDLQAKLDEAKAIDVSGDYKDLVKFKQHLVAKIDRVVPRKQRYARPTKQDWQELKRYSLKSNEDNLESARRQLDEAARDVARENELIRSVRSLLAKLR